jgi:hypothetical protein
MKRYELAGLAITPLESEFGFEIISHIGIWPGRRVTLLIVASTSYVKVLTVVFKINCSSVFFFFEQVVTAVSDGHVTLPNFGRDG